MSTKPTASKARAIPGVSTTSNSKPASVTKKAAPAAKKPSTATAKPATPATKPAAKPAVVAKAAIKPTAAKAKTAGAKKPVKKAVKKDVKKAKPEKVRSEKVKMERDSFTMPKEEYAQITLLKARLTSMGQPAKKSELLRAGIKLLTAMSDNTLKTTLAKIPVIKTGRPTK